MHLWTRPRMSIKHFLHWNCTMLGEGTLSNANGVSCLLKLMGEFQLEWHVSSRKGRGCLLPKHIGWQSIERCEQWDLNNLQTTACHIDLRLLLKKSLDKMVSVRWMTSFFCQQWCVLWRSIAFLPTCVWNAAPYGAENQSNVCNLKKEKHGCIELFRPFDWTVYVLFWN